MLKIASNSIILFVSLLCLFTAAQAQSKAGGAGNPLIVGLKTTGSITKEVAVIVVGQTAKVGWKATKFTAKELAAPAAKSIIKPLVVKAAPKAGQFMLKQTGNAVEKGVPIAAKLLIKYIKYKIVP
jgi:hypothetical protein